MAENNLWVNQSLLLPFVYEGIINKKSSREYMGGGGSTVIVSESTENCFGMEVAD